MPEHGMERHPAPVHLVLTNNDPQRRSIFLSRQSTVLYSQDFGESTNLETRVHGGVNLDHEIGACKGICNVNPSHFSRSYNFGESNSTALRLGAVCPTSRLAFALRLRNNFRLNQLSIRFFSIGCGKFPQWQSG